METFVVCKKELQIKGHGSPGQSVDGLQPTRDPGGTQTCPCRHGVGAVGGGAPTDTLLFKSFDIIPFITAISKNIPFTQHRTA